MTVFGATLNSIVDRPDFVGSPNSTRVVTAGNPDVPAPALHQFAKVPRDAAVG